LFLGVAIDGSALEIDHNANGMYYGSPTAEVPSRLPESAAQLRHYLVELTPPAQGAPIAGEAPQAILPRNSPKKLEALRRSLVQNAGQLHSILSPEWRQYLAIPKELMDPAGHPSTESMTDLEARFTKIASSPNYKNLAERPEFQATHEVLRAYIEATTASRPTLQLPAPPK